MTCPACAAKDELIRQLLQQQAETNAQIITMARDATGLNQKPVEMPEDPDPLDAGVAAWIDSKFNPNTGLWRQQRRAARDLQREGLSPAEVVDVLRKGAQVEL